MVMDYRGYGFTREGQEMFYRDIRKQKQEIENMNIDEDVKEDLISQTDNLVKEYESSKIRHLNAQIFKIKSEADSKRIENASKTIASKLREINDGLEDIKKKHVPGNHLMDGKNSWN